MYAIRVPTEIPKTRPQEAGGKAPRKIHSIDETGNEKTCSACFTTWNSVSLLRDEFDICVGTRIANMLEVPVVQEKKSLY